MEKIWLEQYPAGVPKSINLDAQETLIDVFERAVKQFANRPAYSCMGQTITFSDLNLQSARFAGYLQQRLGLEKGDRVALMMPNMLQYPVALFGILRAGLVVVNVNPLYTHRELHHQLVDSEAKAIVVVANSAHVLEEAMAEGTKVRSVIVTEVGDMLDFPKRQIVNFAVRHIKRLVRPYKLPNAKHFDEVLQSSRSTYQRPRELSGADTAFLQYTGGTTGVSKGATLSHTNMIANMRQINAWFSGVTRPGQDVVLTPLPLYHVYALTCNCLAYLETGGHNILITDPRDTKGLIKEMGRWPLTVITGVNTLYQSLVNHPGLADLNLTGLKIVSAGGMAVMEPTANKWKEITGTNILEGYGLSEASPVVTTNVSTAARFTGSIGLPLPDTEISLRDDDGNEVPEGEPGELCVRGPQVMKGYWKRPEATEAAMTSDGFLRTGDVATVDPLGFFRIVDRKKDMILVSGFNVYPSEVEEVLVAHADVDEAAVIGLPDGRGTEQVIAYVVAAPGRSVSMEALREYCRHELTPYKRPERIELRTDLPKSNVGKVLRRELREEALAALEAE